MIVQYSIQRERVELLDTLKPPVEVNSTGGSGYTSMMTGRIIGLRLVFL